MTVATASITDNLGLHLDNRTLYLNYLNGLKASSNDAIYSVNVTNEDKSANSYTVGIWHHPSTNL